ncbi:MAG: hypothetical protein OXG55_01355 [bacterium]|nr:hypothetical protein [bacterium]
MIKPLVEGVTTAAPGESGPPRPVLSPDEKRVLAALARRPLGLAGCASVAVASGVGDGEVRQALGRLEALGLVSGDVEVVHSRPVRREVVWRLRVGEQWFAAAPEVQRTPIPTVPPEPMTDRLPQRFHQQFWWGDPSVIRLPRDAAFVAEQLLSCDDIESWAWVISTLPADVLEQVAADETTSPETAAMVRNALAERCAEAV